MHEDVFVKLFLNIVKGLPSLFSLPEIRTYIVTSFRHKPFFGWTSPIIIFYIISKEKKNNISVKENDSEKIS